MAQKEISMDITNMAEDFIKKFHNLEGTLLKQKKKSLFLLLESSKSLQSNEEVLKKIFVNLTPKTYLEEIYKLEILIYFRRASELLVILQNGNDIAATKIINQPWFAKTLFSNMKPKEFVLNVFPKLSVVVRSKILKRILKDFKDEEYINGLFDELIESYGLKPALIILPGCSVDKIRNILDNRGLSLSKPQLKLLHSRDSSLISSYFENYQRKGGSINDFKDILIYLAKIDPNLYIELALKYKICLYNLRLGRRTTRKFITENEEIVTNEPEKYISLNIFEKNALVRQLGKNFPKFIKALFPKQISNLMTSEVHNLLGCYPKQKRYDLYSTLFKEVYGISLLSSKKFITDELLEVIKSDEEREAWVAKFEDDVKYIKYKRSSIAIPELKEHLLKCDDIKFRKELLTNIVTACSIGKDYAALLDILQLVCKRFRNTDATVFDSFLGEIHKRIKLENLNEEHWKYIHEIILVQHMRNISINSYIVLEYSRFLYKSGKSFEEMIPIYLSANNLSIRNFEFTNEKFRDDKFQREFLRLVLKHYSETKEKENLVENTEIVLAIRDWNKHHPNDFILVSENAEIIEAVKKSINTGWIYFLGTEMMSMKYLLCRENILELADIYFNHLDYLENVTMTKWFLKYQPSIFEQKIDKVFECMNIKTRYSLMKFLKKYEHTGLVHILTNYYLAKLKDAKVDKDKIAGFLASIMPRSEYLKLLEQYVPTIDKLDLMNANEEQINLAQIQNALAKSVRFTTCQVGALPILLKYCRGDYFQSSLFSLYSCFNRLSEESLKPLLETLMKKPVSVRKHSIFLAAMVFTVKTNEELSQKIIDSDKNDSIQKHLFTSSYKYFLKNPLEPFWNIVKKYMGTLTTHEKESLLLLCNPHVIPENYRGEFTQKVWEVFEDLGKKENVSMDIYFNNLLQNIKDDDMRFLPSDLCMNIVSSKLFKERYKENSTCTHFAIQFMMYGGDISKNVQNILGVLKTYKDEYWNSDESGVAKSVIYNFCTKVFQKTMNKRELRIFLPKEFTLVFSEEWKKVFKFQETFEEYLMLDFMILKHGNSKDLTFYAKEICRIFEEVKSAYGDLILSSVSDFLSDSVQLLLGEKNYELKLMKLLASILEENSSTPYCLLVIKLLPYSQADDEFTKNYNYVMEKFKNNSEIVQIYLNTDLKKRTYL